MEKEKEKNMSKTIKRVISIIMSLAVAICIVPTCVGAEEISEENILSLSEDDISLQSLNVGKEYYHYDGKGNIVVIIQFTDRNRMLVKYVENTKTSRYINMYVSTINKTFGVRNFVVKGKQTHSEAYNLNINSVTKLKVEIFRHTSTNPKSAQIDPISFTYTA